ncbi:DNA (cytosine-5)-methyltransferase CMT3-like [Malus domestica]|uniref:CMT-type cytosine DNA-methyltransferase 3a n=1 Tax=Malus domestica TaxID=3750 RepID=K7SHJ1_MALDO|nr:DNA (cytosine-5)-methyltransferase CMT3-like [Malus domestica]AFV99135.1 CMT-type cytosine DNA-methyltransferase 3a [Malus domestica]
MQTKIEPNRSKSHPRYQTSPKSLRSKTKQNPNPITRALKNPYRPSLSLSLCSPPKSKNPRQTKNVEKSASPPKSKNPRQTNEARVEEEVATSVEKAASLPRKPVTQEVAAADEDGEESRFSGKPMEDEETRKQYPKRYVGENYALLAISCECSMYFTGSRKERKKCYERTITKSIALCFDFDPCIGAEGKEEWAKKLQRGETKEPYICKIVEMFEAIGGLLYFTAQWYYRSQDTVIKHCASVACGHVDQDVKSKSIPVCNYYCDTKYLLPYSTFVNLQTGYCSLSTYCHDAEIMQSGSDDSTISVSDDVCLDSEVDSKLSNGVCAKSQVRLLDLYSGCGVMSTGLCLAAHLANVNLVTLRETVSIDCNAMLL